jgi:predicted metal-dependent hydrolase
MVNVKQHQMPKRRVVDSAEEAIQIAIDAEMAARHVEADSQKRSSSIQKLEAAQQNAVQAQSQLNSIADESNQQELQQVSEQLEQSIQGLDEAGEHMRLPKQVR